MKTLVAIPCMDMVHTGFFKSVIGMRPVGEARFSLTASSLVYDARNNLAKQAIREGCDRILWLDSDMEFPGDLMQRLAADLDEGRDFVSGLYFRRRAPLAPVVYKQVDYRQSPEGALTPQAVPYDDYPKDSIIEVAGVGFGCCMMTTKVVEDMMKQFGLPFSPILGFGEDLSFCLRLTKMGIKMYCDTSIKCNHIGFYEYGESDYIAQEAAKNGNA